jgi:hypothetical protein
VGVIVAHDSSLTTLRGQGSRTRPVQTTKPFAARYRAKDLERGLAVRRGPGAPSAPGVIPRPTMLTSWLVCL